MTSLVDWEALGVACPKCLDPLKPVSPEELRCTTCWRNYPLYFGIPDLRTGDDPYLTRADDLAAASGLAQRAPRMDFRELLASYYATNDKVPPAQAALFTHGAVAAGARAAATLAAWQRQDRRERHEAAAGSIVIDVGCGTGPLTVALARGGFRAIGVDVGLRWLVLARKRALEAGVNVPFICANAEVLPFRDGIALRAGGESMLENASVPERALNELARVLRHGGRLWLSTPNKHSLGPDPHLGVLAGGWWPEALLRRHATTAGKVFPHRTLFTAGSLRHALEAAEFSDVSIQLPDIASEQAATLSLALRGAIAGYRIAKAIPIVHGVLRAVAPTYLVTATRL